MSPGLLGYIHFICILFDYGGGPLFFQLIYQTKKHGKIAQNSDIKAILILCLYTKRCSKQEKSGPLDKNK